MYRAVGSGLKNDFGHRAKVQVWEVLALGSSDVQLRDRRLGLEIFGRRAYMPPGFAFCVKSSVIRSHVQDLVQGSG